MTRKGGGGGVAVALLLLLLLLCSAIGVVFSSHQSRQLFHELEQLRRQAWALDEDWERLQLEQSAWAAHERVRQVAEDRLGMVVPEAGAVKVIHERNHR